MEKYCPACNTRMGWEDKKEDADKVTYLWKCHNVDCDYQRRTGTPYYEEQTYHK
jgi:hypothetical protein